ncbi:hypothetical protein EDD17DRAFT_1491423, partial [Pisolithus thermaeus]
EEWAAQVHSQTQPLPWQSKNKGANLLAHILSLEKSGGLSNFYGQITCVVDNHLQSHVQSAIKRREPAISQLITTYNNLCDELLGMIQLQKAPPGAIPHLPIPTKGIFSTGCGQ